MPWTLCGPRRARPAHAIEVWYQYFQQLPFAAVAWADRLLDAYFGNYTIDFVDAGYFVHFELPDVAAREVRGFFCR